MESRRFNSIFPYVNEKWTAEVLGMQVNQKRGPDLSDEEKHVEVKFMISGEKAHATKYPRCWTVQNHQLQYTQNGKPCYWGLGKYELAIPVSKVTTTNTEELEGLVLSREL